MCKHISSLETNTKFVILMHPKEYRKTKNGTGHLTNKSLTNSELYIGIDFSNDERINAIINSKLNDCYLLYPGEDSINLNIEPIISKKNIVVFIIDSTWPCSKKILRVSKNLRELKKISFINNQTSQFKIKTQPEDYCLSTIESTKYLLELLNKHTIEKISDTQLKSFIKPFEKMVEYQIKCAKVEDEPRFKRIS